MLWNLLYFFFCRYLRTLAKNILIILGVFLSGVSCLFSSSSFLGLMKLSSTSSHDFFLNVGLSGQNTQIGADTTVNMPPEMSLIALPHFHSQKHS
jgi:hypothetical protein